MPEQAPYLHPVPEPPEAESGGRGGGGGGSFDSRLARLETHITYLATREDVQGVRTELESVKTSLATVEGKIEELKSWALMRIIIIICLIGGLVLGALRLFPPGSSSP